MIDALSPENRSNVVKAPLCAAHPIVESIANRLVRMGEEATPGLAIGDQDLKSIAVAAEHVEYVEDILSLSKVKVRHSVSLCQVCVHQGYFTTGIDEIHLDALFVELLLNISKICFPWHGEYDPRFVVSQSDLNLIHLGWC